MLTLWYLHVCIYYIPIDLKAKVETQQLVIQQMENSLRDKERDCAERVNQIREEEFQKLSQINHEK